MIRFGLWLLHRSWLCTNGNEKLKWVTRSVLEAAGRRRKGPRKRGSRGLYDQPREWESGSRDSHSSVDHSSLAQGPGFDVMTDRTSKGFRFRNPPTFHLLKQLSCLKKASWHTYSQRLSSRPRKPLRYSWRAELVDLRADRWVCEEEGSFNNRSGWKAGMILPVPKEVIVRMLESAKSGVSYLPIHAMVSFIARPQEGDRNLILLRAVYSCWITSRGMWTYDSEILLKGEAVRWSFSLSLEGKFGQFIWSGVERSWSDRFWCGGFSM